MIRADLDDGGKKGGKVGAGKKKKGKGKA